MSYKKKSCAAKALHQLEKCLLQIEKSAEKGCENDEATQNSMTLLKAEIEKLKIEVEKESEQENQV